jgi:hypothetical protein
MGETPIVAVVVVTDEELPSRWRAVRTPAGSAQVERPAVSQAMTPE